jgi:multicomponent Na+:H+ antiporter subunit C
MTILDLYALAGLGIFVLGLHAVVVRAHLVWKVLAINLMGTGIFILLLAAPVRADEAVADPLPQAMVLTGIVVAVAATALALGMALRVTARTGSPFLSEGPEPDHPRSQGGEDGEGGAK